jgi:hypothetical protein
MGALIYLPLLVPALAAVAARPLAGRLEPLLATWLLTAVTVALAAFSTAALALLAPPPRRQLTLLAVAALLVLIAGVSAAEAARDPHALVEYAQAAR